MSEFLSKKEFETWKNNLEKRINLDMIKGEIPSHFPNFNDYEQRKRQNFNSTGAAVVFDVAYTEIPVVVVSSEDPYYNASAESVTLIGFTGKVRKNDGSTGTIACHWHAVGRV